MALVAPNLRTVASVPLSNGQPGLAWALASLIDLPVSLLEVGLVELLHVRSLHLLVHRDRVPVPLGLPIFFWR